MSDVLTNNFKEDVQIKELPKCANPNCNERGFVYIGGEFYCGRCTVKLSDKAKEARKMFFSKI